MATQTCVRCGKTEDVPYYTSWWQGHCDRCTKIALKNYQGKLGDTTGERTSGGSAYPYNENF